MDQFGDEERLTEPITEVDPTSGSDINPTLYKIDIDVIVKDIMSQKIGSPKAVFQVNVNTLEDFLDCVWTMIETHISREIFYNFESEQYEWADNELNVNSMYKFVVFVDKSSK